MSQHSIKRQMIEAALSQAIDTENSNAAWHSREPDYSPLNISKIMAENPTITVSETSSR